MIPLVEDPGGGGGVCTATPLGPWPYCNSADESGELGGDSGAGGEGSTTGALGRKTISVSSSPPLNSGSICLFTRAASRCIFRRLLFAADLITVFEKLNCEISKNLPKTSV